MEIIAGEGNGAHTLCILNPAARTAVLCLDKFGDSLRDTIRATANTTDCTILTSSTILVEDAQ